MKFVFNPDVILCWWLGSKHQLTSISVRCQSCSCAVVIKIGVWYAALRIIIIMKICTAPISTYSGCTGRFTIVIATLTRPLIHTHACAHTHIRMHTRVHTHTHTHAHTRTSLTDHRDENGCGNTNGLETVLEKLDFKSGYEWWRRISDRLTKADCSRQMGRYKRMIFRCLVLFLWGITKVH